MACILYNMRMKCLYAHVRTFMIHFVQYSLATVYQQIAVMSYLLSNSTKFKMMQKRKGEKRGERRGEMRREKKKKVI